MPYFIVAFPSPLRPHHTARPMQVRNPVQQQQPAGSVLSRAAAKSGVRRSQSRLRPQVVESGTAGTPEQHRCAGLDAGEALISPRERVITAQRWLLGGADGACNACLM